MGVIYGSSDRQKTLQTDSATGALVTIDYPHAELHSGDHFMYRRYHSLARNATSNHLIVTPDTGRWAHMVIGVETITSAVVVQLYEGVTYSALGSLETPVNRNRNVAKLPTTLIYESPTGAAGGVLLRDYYLGAGRNSEGGSNRDAEEILLKQNTVYLLRITEQNVAATVVNINFDWYEYTNK